MRVAGARSAGMQAAASWLALVLTLAAPPPAAGQGAEPDAGPHAVQGSVAARGSAGPVAGAEVRLEGPVRVRALTDDRGAWRVAGLPAGEYRIEVHHLAYVVGHSTVRIPRNAAGPLDFALEQRALPLDELVVTANRRLQPLADVPVATEVVRIEELRRSGASDLASVLTERTGVQLQGGHPTGAGVMLQGMDSERVLVLVDGQPWVGRMSGTSDLARLPVQAIERVEIVKGPQATLYGSEAMGGVVNVITRRPALSGGWRGGVTLTSGSQDRLDAHARVSGRLGGARVSADLGRRQEDLVPGGSNGGSSGAGVTRRDLHARLAWGDVERVAYDVSVLAVDEDQRWSSGQLRHFADNLQGALTAGVSAVVGGHRLTTSAHGSLFDHLARRGTRAEPPPPSAGERQRQWLGELDLAWSWAPDAGPVVDGGLELAYEGIEAETVTGRTRETTTWEPYLQATFEAGPVQLVPGLRLSHSTRWGSHWTPRLALMTRPLPGLALRASAAAGYRAPSFKELWLDFLNSGPGFGYLVRGNTSLEPETSTNLSAGAEWSGARVYARTQLFHNRFRGFIETRALPDSAGLTMYTYGNIARGVTRGVELEAGWNAEALSAEVGYARLDTRDDGTGEPLLGRPEHSARAAVTTPVFGVRTHVAATWTGATPISRDEEGTTLEREPYLRFDARLARGIGPVELAFGVDNLFDRIPRDWPGFAGRRVYLSLTSTLFGTDNR